MTAVVPFSKGVAEAAARGWEPILANFLMPTWVRSHWPKYQEGCARRLKLHGSVNRVMDYILAFREQVGDFGTLLYAGKDWCDPTLARRSMELMADKVMPTVDAAIGRGPGRALPE